MIAVFVLLCAIIVFGCAGFIFGMGNIGVGFSVWLSGLILLAAGFLLMYTDGVVA